MEAYVLGAGGHAKVVIACLRDLGHKVVAAFDDSEDRWNHQVLGVPIVGPLERVEELPRCPTVIGIGENGVRRSIARRFQLDWLSLVHPAASIDPTVRLGQGVVVIRGAAVQVDSCLGDHVIVNTAASVDHDCTIGDFAHLAPGVHLAGGVTVGEGSFMGTGAVAVPQVRIGAWTTVGAGGVVIHDLPAHVVAVGVPARFIHPSTHGLCDRSSEC
jgi:sugar O-acyltransferase (sialic acid O-acetyltransferase NeuD family)